jgi:hypothetical protein
MVSDVSDHPENKLKKEDWSLLSSKKYFGVPFIQKMKAGT